MKRIPGMKSYTSDPSLRRHHFGPIEPMEAERGNALGAVIAALVIGGLVFIIF